MSTKMIIYYIQVYTFENKLEGIYVGATQNFKAKKESDLRALRRKNHSSILLQCVYNKFGEDNLKFIFKGTCSENNYVQRKAEECEALKRQGINLYNSNIPRTKSVKKFERKTYRWNFK